MPTPIAGELEFTDDAFSVIDPYLTVDVFIQRTNGDEGRVVVDYATFPGTAVAGLDYVAQTGSVVFVNGDNGPKKVTIAILPRPTVSGDVTFFVALSNPTNFAVIAPPGVTTVTIQRRSFGEANFAGPNWFVKNPDPNPPVILDLFVQRDIQSRGTVSVQWQTVDGTAIAGVDYTAGSGTLNWADGDGSFKTIAITIIPRPGGPFPDRDFTVNLFGATGGLVIGTVNPATVTVTDVAPPANPTVTASVANQIVDLLMYTETDILIEEAIYNNPNILVNSGYGGRALHSSFNSIWAVSATVAWAVGNNGVIYATTNGGTTWTPQTSGTNKNLNSVFFIDANTGWAVGSDGTILKTVDGGANWTPQTSGTPEHLYGVAFASSTVGWAVGANGILLKTTNGGATWVFQNSSTFQDLHGVSVASTSDAWAVGAGGTIIATTNGGTTWAGQATGTTENLNSVSFVSTTTGWAVGDLGTILKTTNGGAAWVAQTSGTLLNLHGVSFTSTTVGWAVGNTGLILATIDGGTTWTPQTSGLTENLMSVSAASTTVAYIAGVSTLLKTTNGGTTWTSQLVVPPVIGYGGLGNGGGTSNYGGGADFFDGADSPTPTSQLRFAGYET